MKRVMIIVLVVVVNCMASSAQADDSAEWPGYEDLSSTSKVQLIKLARNCIEVDGDVWYVHPDLMRVGYVGKIEDRDAELCVRLRDGLRRPGPFETADRGAMVLDQRITSRENAGGTTYLVLASGEKARHYEQNGALAGLDRGDRAKLVLVSSSGVGHRIHGIWRQVGPEEVYQDLMKTQVNEIPAFDRRRAPSGGTDQYDYVFSPEPFHAR